MKKVYLIQYRSFDNHIFENKVKLLGEWVKYFSDNWLIFDALVIFFSIVLLIVDMIVDD